MTEPFGDDLTDGLDDQSYEIQDELRMRKKLENQTDWQFEFRKNDKYDYDLEVTEWDEEAASGDDHQTLGYVELERSRNDKSASWISGDIPDCWVFLSFLKRKVRRYNRRTESWGGPKKNHDKTVYLKFSHRLDNCFAVPIESIHRDGTPTPRSDGSRQNSYLKLDSDHPDVHHGISDCVEFIRSYMTETNTDRSR
jgi:hypothetical protein